MLRSLIGLVAFSLLVVAAPVAEERAADACTDVIVIFARGTTETAPIGTIVGPPLQAALEVALAGKTLTFTGVDYAADIAGFLEGGDPAGSVTMAQDACLSMLVLGSSFIQAAIVTSGYSQGGQLVHNSAAMLSSSVLARIKAAVIFVGPVRNSATTILTFKQGDPDDGEAVQGVPAANTDVICHVGDDICLHGDLILPPHLTYGMDTPAAAAFIAARV